MADDLDLVFCACDEQVYDAVDHGSDGFLSIQEFTNQRCQVDSNFNFYQSPLCKYM